jgi:hypothetical protein
MNKEITHKYTELLKWREVMEAIGVALSLNQEFLVEECSNG